MFSLEPRVMTLNEVNLSTKKSVRTVYNLINKLLHFPFFIRVIYQCHFEFKVHFTVLHVEFLSGYRMFNFTAVNKVNFYVVHNNTLHHQPLSLGFLY